MCIRDSTKRCRRIADAMGKAQGDPCIMNIWVHDGSKDRPWSASATVKSSLPPWMKS